MSNQKKVLVTGVTKGIGYALCEWLGTEGHLVFGCGRSAETLKKMKALPWAASCHFEAVNVSSAEEVKNWIEGVVNQAGAPDLVINNAGVANSPNPLWDVPLVEFDRVIDINIKGVNYVIHAVTPHLIKAGKGVIINMSSGWGRSTASTTAPYCCSKWGIEGLSLALAKDLPSPLACAPLNPGMINTDMLGTFFGEDAKLSRTPTQWAKTAGPWLLTLDRSCNGKQLTAP